MERPMKPHREGYEDEEDCEGYYDPDEAERRRCHTHHQRSPDDPCEKCFKAWRVKEDAEYQARWNAKTPEERAQHERLVKGLKELY